MKSAVAKLNLSAVTLVHSCLYM